MADYKGQGIVGLHRSETQDNVSTEHMCWNPTSFYNMTTSCIKKNFLLSGSENSDIWK